MVIGKYNTEWTEEKYKKFLQEGRGQGEGKDYKPWLTVYDFPSMGRATRVFGYKTQRIHHFFSDLQLKYFYLLEWEERVVDIREHFPLLDLEEAITDKGNLKLDKFKDKETGVPYVLSTTFLITIVDEQGNKRLVARSIKNASELEKKISLEKLEIERRYWQCKGVDWAIVTNKGINSVRAKNIEWLHSVLTAEEYNGLSAEEMADLGEGLLYRLAGNQQPIRKVISEYERDYCLETGMGIVLFKYLLSRRKLCMNMDEPVNLNLPATSLWIPADGKGELSDDGYYG